MAKLEWQEPTDSSPVRVPTGWWGGGLEGIGGGGVARTWYHEDDPVRVIYEPFHKTVVLQDNSGGGSRTIESREARELTDRALAKKALELMEWYNRERDVGSDTGFVFGDSFDLGLR